jgi:hypothetical protein
MSSGKSRLIVPQHGNHCEGQVGLDRLTVRQHEVREILFEPGAA